MNMMFRFEDYSITDVNTRKVLQCILEKGPITKRRIQKNTGLSWGGVYNSISKLLDKNVILETGQIRKDTPGRSPNLFDINYKENLSVGLDVTLGKIIGVVSHLDGKCIYSKTLSMKSNLSQDVIEGLLNVLYEIYDFVKEADYIKTIGLALPGSTIKGWDKEGLEHPFHGIFPKNLKDLVEEKFGAITGIFTDPDCLLASEINNLADKSNKDIIVVLRWSYGIGLSMLMDGKIYQGSNRMSGEIGHTVIDPNGELCSCGKRGCLETYASLQSLIRKIGPVSNFKEILNLYNNHDPYARKIVDDAMDKMSIILANTINIIDPTILIIGGEFASLPKEVFESFKAKIYQHIMIGSETQILQSNLDDKATALGAALLMRDKIYYEVFELK